MAQKKAKVASLDALKKKQPVTKSIEIEISGDSGEPEKVTIIFKALGAHAYDKLVEKFPPTRAQREDGLAFNIDKFAPALIAACSLEPELTDEDAQEIWESDAWNRGELMQLFTSAIEVNNKGLDIPFTALD